MRVQVIGTEQECRLAFDVLDFVLDVQEISSPRPVGDGLVQVDALVVDPADPANQPSDAELEAELGIPLPDESSVSAGPPCADATEEPSDRTP